MNLLDPDNHKKIVALYLDAFEAALEICRDHGLPTGHGDTLADVLREINGQLAERESRAAVKAGERGEVRKK